MIRILIEKVIGSALLLSALVILIMMVWSLPDAQKNLDAWASYEDSRLLFVCIIIIEIVFIISRAILGYFIFVEKMLPPWLFYLLMVIVAISGLSGIILVLPLLALRFWNKFNGVTES